MRTRLVAGCGSIGTALLADLTERRGDRLVVLTDEGVEKIQERYPSLEIVTADPTDPDVLRSVGTVDTVVVASDDPERNVDAAAAARESFPDVFILAYPGRNADDETVGTLQTLADRLLDPADIVGSYLAERVETGGTSLHKLRSVLASIDGPLAVVMHDNPDPDAIASAVAFERIADRLGCAAQACYFGSINHQENRAMVNLLEYDLRQLEPDADLSEFGGFALVDHARPGVNDCLPETTPIDVVIDHHPPRAPVTARYTDLRSDAGATSTLLVEYYRHLGADIAIDIATGLLFGIRVDTDEFSREVSVSDFEAGAYLLENADLGLLERVENPNMSSDTLETIAEAITSRRQHGTILFSGVGGINDRDTLAQAADRLLHLEGVTTTLVYGITNGTVYISARSRGTDLDLGEALRAAFDPIGSAGGHVDMAGAQIELGVLETIDDDDQTLRSMLDDLVTEQFLEVLDIHSSHLSESSFGIDDEPVDLLD
ncbi:MAG: DHH family phosphoesterase [archaeon]